MASYEPPTENLAIFDPSVFITGDEALTYNEAVKKFLKYPNAQGAENLQAINVNGVAEFNTTANFNSTTTFDGNATFNATSDIIQQAGSEILQEPASTIIATSGANELNRTLIAVNTGTTSTPAFEIYNQTTGYATYFINNASNNAYDNIVQANDNVIASTRPLVLTNSGSTSTNGIRLSNTTSLIGYGGSADTPTTYVECDGTNVLVNPNIKFPDNSVQSNAYTGAGALTGSYTLANITIDSNGKITAISNGSAGTQFVPKFHNFSNTQNGTTGYSQGPYINWGSGWGANDYAIIRVRAQVNWGNSGSGWTQYATTAGELILRPHFAPAGVIGSLGGGSIFYTTNSGSVMGATQKLAYYTGAINNGSQGYFYLYGNGGSGGGASGSVQLMCGAPGSANGWEYTCSYEYIIHSGSGASISFTNGPGGGSGPTTNNSLP